MKLSRSDCCACLFNKRPWTTGLRRFISGVGYALICTLALILPNRQGNFLFRGLFFLFDRGCCQRDFAQRQRIVGLMLLAGLMGIGPESAYGVQQQAIIGDNLPQQQAHDTQKLALVNPKTEWIAQANPFKRPASPQQKPYLYDYATNVAGIVNAQDLVETDEADVVLIPATDGDEEEIVEGGTPLPHTNQSKPAADMQNALDYGHLEQQAH